MSSYPFLRMSLPFSSMKRIMSPVFSLKSRLASAGMVTCPFVESLQAPNTLFKIIHLPVGYVKKVLYSLLPTLLTCKQKKEKKNANSNQRERETHNRGISHKSKLPNG